MLQGDTSSETLTSPPPPARSGGIDKEVELGIKALLWEHGKEAQWAGLQQHRADKALSPEDIYVTDRGGFTKEGEGLRVQRSAAVGGTMTWKMRGWAPAEELWKCGERGSSGSGQSS